MDKRFLSEFGSPRHTYCNGFSFHLLWILNWNISVQNPASHLTSTGHWWWSWWRRSWAGWWGAAPCPPSLVGVTSTGGRATWGRPGRCSTCRPCRGSRSPLGSRRYTETVELQTKVSEDFTISWLKAPNSAFTFKTLLRHNTMLNGCLKNTVSRRKIGKPTQL